MWTEIIVLLIKYAGYGGYCLPQAYHSDQLLLARSDRSELKLLVM